MKKILVALDYDSTAQKVAEEGYSLANAMKSKLVMLHVVSDPKNYSSSNHFTVTGFGGHPDLDPNKPIGIDELKKIAQNYLEKIKQNLGQSNVSILVRDGESAETIISVAKELHADYIVMGSYSQLRMENAELGGNTRRVMQNAMVPVLIVPMQRHNP